MRKEAGRMRRLVRGSKGRAVRQLQLRLQSLGYDVGTVDGLYGYVTEDAVVQFQREHGLKVDGVAGPQVYMTLEGAPLHFRHVHVVQKDEARPDLALQYGVPETFIARSRGGGGHTPLYEGEVVVLRSTYVLASSGGKSEGPVEGQAKAALSGWVEFSTWEDVIQGQGRHEGPRANVATDEAGEDAGNDPPLDRFVGVSVGTGENAAYGASGRRGRVEGMADGIYATMVQRKAHGLFLETVPRGGAPIVNGKALVRLVRAVRRRAPDALIFISLPPPARGWRRFITDVHYEDMSRWVDRIVMATHRWPCLLGDGFLGLLDDGRLEGALATACRRVPPWKVMVGVPLGAVEREGDKVTSVPYRQALVQAYVARRRPLERSDGLTTLDTSDATSVLQTRRGVEYLLRLVGRYRAGGVYLHPLGYEDERVWPLLRGHLRPGSLIT